MKGPPITLDAKDLLAIITRENVCCGIVDVLEGKIEDDHNPPNGWGYEIAGHMLGARQMVARALSHCCLRVPLKTNLPLDGNTDKACRDRLEALGFILYKI